jgi:hypothetical protein
VIDLLLQVSQSNAFFNVMQSRKDIKESKINLLILIFINYLKET